MNHYDCLKVTSDAPTEVIRAAYRALAGKRHPDRQGGTMGRDDEMHEQMVAINAAYEVLINPELRAEYDALLATKAMTKAKAKPAASNQARAMEMAEGDNGFSETRVDIDWMTPKPSGPTPLWPLTPNRKYAAIILGVVVALSAIWVGWGVVSRHQMDKALSDQYAAHPAERTLDDDQMSGLADAAPTPASTASVTARASEPTVAMTPEELLAAEQGMPLSRPEAPPPSFERQPTVTELSKLSDEQLMAILPSLGELQPAKGSFSRQVASTPQHHPLDGKPLNLRQERQLVDSLAPAAPLKR
ncbi:J domain-containing protein [Aquabacterium sp.]|uniref:J domain-containing protein n=1 Tax=Aquabacterium sp. TaxID=1872578 RepID=UPI001988AB8B|nr:J domain-containing protein [Aquabacterium sp.]MBC7701802.1 J domain-containing protein [Aquabacterium sp.]